ncbi:MAG: sigma-70 family RNA polymerase sigma factor, partial [Anaerovoracaceae bacterium]
RDMSSPEPEVLYSELKEVLVGAIDALNEKERLVITLYYYESLKLREIAEILGITESRVSQIHSASIIKMKHRMNKY